MQPIEALLLMRGRQTCECARRASRPGEYAEYSLVSSPHSLPEYASSGWLAIA